jgi:hypothetical protein
MLLLFNSKFDLKGFISKVEPTINVYFIFFELPNSTSLFKKYFFSKALLCKFPLNVKFVGKIFSSCGTLLIELLDIN